MIWKPSREIIRPSRRSFLTGAVGGLIAAPSIIRAGSLSLMGVGKPAGGGGPTTLFSASPALNANDVNTGTSFRICCPITGSSSTQIRATFQASTTTGLTTGHCSIGKRDPAEVPNYPNTLATPLQLLFSGGSGFSIGSSASITSDWLTLSGFSLTTGDQAVVIFDATTPGGQRFNNANTGVTTFYQSGSSWNVADTIGLGFTDISNTNYAIVSVETQ